MKYLLDTHAWIWWNMHPQKLSRKVKALIGDTNKYEELLLSAISPWEFSKLLEKGRLGISCNPEAWITIALNMPKLRLCLYPQSLHIDQLYSLRIFMVIQRTRS